MKVLVTSTPGLGHILPMVPLVRELRDRGHELRWIGGDAALGEAVEHVLHAPGPRRAAVELAEEIASMPDRTAVARGIEAFVSV